ncbi:hypothetical protein FB459_1910 [Yimella lutea]|uniref:Uncharacterized protein n=1 Tax=Yimella lutea TaxID=587872 RepID=A0A542EGK9_9MICO|nr:hypothetical protein FB459_1910 [Yimella lutea]
MPFLFHMVELTQTATEKLWADEHPLGLLERGDLDLLPDRVEHPDLLRYLDSVLRRHLCTGSR